MPAILLCLYLWSSSYVYASDDVHTPKQEEHAQVGESTIKSGIWTTLLNALDGDSSKAIELRQRLLKVVHRADAEAKVKAEKDARNNINRQLYDKYIKARLQSFDTFVSMISKCGIKVHFNKQNDKSVIVLLNSSDMINSCIYLIGLLNDTKIKENCNIIVVHIKHDIKNLLSIAKTQEDKKQIQMLKSVQDAFRALLKKPNLTPENIVEFVQIISAGSINEEVVSKIYKALNLKKSTDFSKEEQSMYNMIQENAELKDITLFSPGFILKDKEKVVKMYVGVEYKDVTTQDADGKQQISREVNFEEIYNGLINPIDESLTHEDA